jgi:hypothetical protein
MVTFPPVSAALADSTATDSEARAFLGAVDRWRADALTWLDQPATAHRLSPGLRALLVGILTTPGTDRAEPLPVPAPYAVRALPAFTGPPVGAARQVLTWRAAIVDFLSDVWDTIGPAPYQFEECTLVIRELFTTDTVRNTTLCRDCLQPLPPDPRDAAAHVFACPVRLHRAELG